MKLDKLTISAVIPVAQYANLQPSIELSDVTLEEGTNIGIEYVKDLFAKYSEKGALTEKDILLTKFSKKSFNEPDVTVEFEPINHTYSLEGKKLVSATEYIKKFYKEFDVETMASVSGKSWGVDPQDVKSLWKSNGDLTSAFGTVIHNALEQIDRFQEIGETISTKKKLPENYAMPKHPVLKAIVEEFIALEKPTGKIVPEALITNSKDGYTGHADRILIVDEKKKICRVQDYKINIGSEEITSSLKPSSPFDKFPANKITKYQLQMSFYANMMEATGWTVEGLDVFVYEDVWKLYQLDVLKVI